MGHTHWTEDELLDRLYGLAAGEGESDCPECRARWEELRRRRTRLLLPPQLPPALLADQRRSLRERVERHRSAWNWWLVPALPALLAVAFFLQPNAPREYAELANGAAGSDQALFEQVFREVTRAEPLALSPAQALFEVNP